MSEQHRIMQEIKMDDSLIAHDMQQEHLEALNNSEAILSESAMQEILAEDAHHKAQAFREAMPEDKADRLSKGIIDSHRTPAVPFDDVDPTYEQFIDNHPSGIYPE